MAHIPSSQFEQALAGQMDAQRLDKDRTNFGIFLFHIFDNVPEELLRTQPVTVCTRDIPEEHQRRAFPPLAVEGLGETTIRESFYDRFPRGSRYRYQSREHEYAIELVNFEGEDNDIFNQINGRKILATLHSAYDLSTPRGKVDSQGTLRELVVITNELLTASGRPIYDPSSPAAQPVSS